MRQSYSTWGLPAGHLEFLRGAIHNILSTDLALLTYAQIIDGLPLSDVAWDRFSNKLHPGHPINSHVVLCPGALETAQRMRCQFDVCTLELDSNLLRRYQSTVPHTRSFNLRLLELTAVALHGIAVWLFRRDLRLHDLGPFSRDPATSIESVTSWQRPPDRWATVTPWPTLFTHPSFTAHEQYPAGVADMVGYWAEDRILGGVMLFDQSGTRSSRESNVYFQSARASGTFRPYQLLDGQQQSLLDFLVSPSLFAPSPLPIHVTSRNRVRFDPEDAIPVYKVYRNRWERPKPPRTFLRMQRYLPRRDVENVVDYPEIEDEMKRLRYE